MIDSLFAKELQAGLSLAVILFLRMLALFLLIPVMALLATQYPAHTPLLTGLALGIYGLTQASLQIPFGMMSDRWGRKPVILGGLLLFLLGSLLAAQAQSLWGLIAGRALQGAGAIASVIMALAADLTRSERRTQIMALIGVGVGMAFGAALVFGPILYVLLGTRHLFLLCAGLAGLAIVALYALVPSPTPQPAGSAAPALPGGLVGSLRALAGMPELRRLSLGIFLSHAILMANFTALPLILRDGIGLDTQEHWQFYLPILLIAGLLVGALLALAKRHESCIFRLCILLCLLGQASLSAVTGEYWLLCGAMAVFFIGFSYMEAYLPAQVSRVAPTGQKGAALGLYNTAQFLGIFFGGLMGGLMQEWLAQEAVFLVCAAAALPWLLLEIFRPLRGMTA